MTATPLFVQHGKPRELAYRDCHGLEVTLLWQPATDELTVCVCDHRRGAYFEIRPEAGSGLDVFYHPYLYEPSSAVVRYEDERLVV